MDEVFLPYTFLESEIIMKKILLILPLIILSYEVNAEKNEYFKDCKKLRNDIQAGIYNYCKFRKRHFKKVSRS